LFVFVLCLVYPELSVFLGLSIPDSTLAFTNVCACLSSSCVLCTHGCQCFLDCPFLIAPFASLTFVLVCLRPVSCVPRVASVSWIVHS
jgi:hypothetical protein